MGSGHLGARASVDILRDGGEAARLSITSWGSVNLQLKPKLTSQVGWRYLVDHYGNSGKILNAALRVWSSGATYKLK